MVATGEIRGIFGLSMKSYTSVVICTLFLAFVLPVFVSAQTESAGPKPGTFFYLVDTTFEKVGLFFTFNAEKKARKALGYADKRLAEIEAIDETEKPEVLKKLIANYEDNIALAVEKSKKVTDKEKAEDLFTSIAENTSKNEEVLSAVLINVPEEAKSNFNVKFLTNSSRPRRSCRREFKTSKAVCRSDHFKGSASENKSVVRYNASVILSAFSFNASGI